MCINVLKKIKVKSVALQLLCQQFLHKIIIITTTHKKIDHISVLTVSKKLINQKIKQVNKIKRKRLHGFALFKYIAAKKKTTNNCLV